MENSELNEKGSLPMGGSSQGATDNAMGDASKTDLKTGYFNSDKDDERDNDFDDMPMIQQRGGVLGRPEGWER
jgi:hypothetical protein